MSEQPVLPFTGERYTPERGREIAYEHWHRYALARPLAAGRRVLDAACGEGYGSALMARAGGRVLGLDADVETIEHARRRYAGVPGLVFEQADATALGALPDASFDLVLSFETLEHVQAQEALLDGFARLLAPGGLLLVSTPDKRVYTDLTGEVNPHHVRELYRDEFEALLAPRFPHRRLFGQKLLFQSVLWDLGGHGPFEASTATPEGLQAGLAYAPMYLLAACAREPEALASLPALSLHGDLAESVYADYRDEVRRNRAAAAHIAHLEAEMARLRGRE
ncbi:class I SAM-dependent methyltransferase [Arenimonas sp.]|uniref:class I SAM-dependent methyltransferase n=1 Tax=Arenimonas sp. TaxID=1872635 RepID=UPI0035AFBD28